MNTRFLGKMAAAGAIVTGAALALAPSAHAHEVDPLPTDDPTAVAGNVGNGTDYLLNEVQHGHLAAPLLGFGPLLTDPIGYLGGHVAPVSMETVERLTGISAENEHDHEEEPEEPPHEHE